MTLLSPTIEGQTILIVNRCVLLHTIPISSEPGIPERDGSVGQVVLVVVVVLHDGRAKIHQRYHILNLCHPPGLIGLCSRTSSLSFALARALLCLLTLLALIIIVLIIMVSFRVMILAVSVVEMMRMVWRQ